MKNKIITSEGNIQFIDSEGKVINISPSQVYSMINEDTVSFLLVHLPKSSGLSLFTTKVEDLELNGATYSQSTIADALAEAFSEAGAVGRIEVVDELPSEGKTNTIYLLPKDEGEGYDEYIYIKDESKWELIGDTSIEIKNFLKKSDFNEYSAATKTAIDSKQDTLIAGEHISISGNVISAEDVDLSDYYTKSETSGVTELATAFENKQDTLASGLNIKTINDESILGGGNIEIKGGGFITVTNSNEDTKVGLVNSLSQHYDTNIGQSALIEGDGNPYNLITASGDYSHAEGNCTTASGYTSHAEGLNTHANGLSSHAEGRDTYANGQSSHAEGLGTVASTSYSHAEGYYTQTNGNYSHAEGRETNTTNESEHASGQFNNSVSASTTFGDSGNTLFSVGNGTSISARHNAFEIRQNGDIYLTKDGQDVKLQDQLGDSITIDQSLDSGSTNPVANSAITNAIANATNGTLKEDLVFSATCGYGTLERNVGSPDESALRINIYPAKTLEFIQYRTRYKNYYYKCFVLDIETKTEYNAYWNVTYNSITSSGGTGINYVTLNIPDGSLKFTVTDGTKYRIIGFERDIHSSSSSRESYSTESKYEVNIPSGTTTNELFQYIENVNKSKNNIGLTYSHKYGLNYQNFTDDFGGKMYSEETVFPLNTSFTAHTANTTIHVTSAQTTAWDAKVDTSAITTSISSSSTDSQVPSAKAVYDALQEGGGGGIDDNTQQLIATSLVDLNDRMADKSLLSIYATKSGLDAKANASEVMTLAKATENEKITASALNELNNRIKALEEAIQALQNN